MYSLNSSLLDYEGSDIENSVSERGDSILDEMPVPHTPSFQENGIEKDVSMEMVGGITPMAVKNGSEKDEVRRDVEKAYVSFGQAFRHLKSASLKLGIRAPPTPRGGSTPIRSMTPIGRQLVDTRRLTPGGETRPILPMGLPGNETVQNGNVWMEFKNPPPGYPTMSPLVKRMGGTRWKDAGTSVSGVATSTSTTTTTGSAATAAAATATATVAAETTTSTAAAATSKATATSAGSNWNGGKDLRMKLKRKRSDVREERGEDTEGQRRRGRNMEGQRRKLGNRCERCFGEHFVSECTFHPEELRCRYPPCASKVGHVTAVCHELTKVCVVPVCKGARGHRSFCHETVPGEDGEPYGYTEEAARRLREEFHRFNYLLTEGDWEEMAMGDSSEARQGTAQTRGGGSARRGRGGRGGVGGL